MKNEQVDTIMTGLGFSLYEARAYAALVGENPLTGYELSGRSGIPRSKIYECIERLKRKGLVLPVEGNPVRYVPVPPDELLRRLTSEFQSSVKTLEAALKEHRQTDDVDYIFNIRGYEAIIGKADTMIREAGERLDCSLWDDEMGRLRDACGSAVERDVPIRLISFGAADLNRAELYRHRPLTDSDLSGRWITVIKDRCEVLTGECSDDRESIAAWTRNRSLVYMTMKYIDHEIVRIREAGER